MNMLAARIPMVLSNWKMNKTVNQSLDYLARLLRMSTVWVREGLASISRFFLKL